MIKISHKLLWGRVYSKAISRIQSKAINAVNNDMILHLFLVWTHFMMQCVEYEGEEVIFWPENWENEIESPVGIKMGGARAMWLGRWTSKCLFNNIITLKNYGDGGSTLAELWVTGWGKLVLLETRIIVLLFFQYFRIFKYFSLVSLHLSNLF